MSDRLRRSRRPAPWGRDCCLPKGSAVDPCENGDSKGLSCSGRLLPKLSVFGRTAARGTVDLQDTIAPTPLPARARLARPGGEASHLWRDSLPPARAGGGAAEKKGPLRGNNVQSGLGTNSAAAANGGAAYGVHGGRRRKARSGSARLRESL